MGRSRPFQNLIFTFKLLVLTRATPTDLKEAIASITCTSKYKVNGLFLIQFSLCNFNSTRRFDVQMTQINHVGISLSDESKSSFSNVYRPGKSCIWVSFYIHFDWPFTAFKGPDQKLRLISISPLKVSWIRNQSLPAHFFLLPQPFQPRVDLHKERFLWRFFFFESRQSFLG